MSPLLRALYPCLLAALLLTAPACNEVDAPNAHPINPTWDDVVEWDGPYDKPSGGGTTKPGNRDTSSPVDDADAEQDASPAACTLLPRTNLREPLLAPCCFLDRDCQTSSHPDAAFMRCYAESCTPGGEGVCRIAPSEPGICWTTRDCPEEQRCVDALFGTCESPLFDEHPGLCVR
ncbi:MAG: hypothetical protein H0U74_20070 [Bradymonadaceae bacterium]|nr:hypothetical protein [Lujinxingiaceae bacterium]